MDRPQKGVSIENVVSTNDILLIEDFVVLRDILITTVITGDTFYFYFRERIEI